MILAAQMDEATFFAWRWRLWDAETPMPRSCRSGKHLMTGYNVMRHHFNGKFNDRCRACHTDKERELKLRKLDRSAA